jgi:hypothetical protein
MKRIIIILLICLIGLPLLLFAAYLIIGNQTIIHHEIKRGKAYELTIGQSKCDAFNSLLSLNRKVKLKYIWTRYGRALSLNEASPLYPAFSEWRVEISGVRCVSLSFQGEYLEKLCLVKLVPSIRGSSHSAISDQVDTLATGILYNSVPTILQAYDLGNGQKLEAKMSKAECFYTLQKVFIDSTKRYPRISLLDVVLDQSALKYVSQFDDNWMAEFDSFFAVDFVSLEFLDGKLTSIKRDRQLFEVP